MPFLYVYNHEIHLFLVLFALVVFPSGIQSELCNILDDQGESDKIFCEIGCCGPLEDSFCCVEDESKFTAYYYGYKVAGAIVGFIFGLLSLIIVARCIYAIWRNRRVHVTTVEPGAGDSITVTTMEPEAGDSITVTTSAEVHAQGDIPMQQPASISYPEDFSQQTDILPIVYRDHANSDQQRLVK